MAKKKRAYFAAKRRMLLLYILFLSVLAVSFALMTMGVDVFRARTFLSCLSGALFWIGLLGVLVTTSYITYKRHHCEAFRADCTGLRQMGMVRFFRNRPAVICDAAMFLSIACLIAAAIWLAGTSWPFIFLSFSIFSFGMHCMLNGSNYIYISTNDSVRRATEL